MSEVRAGSSEVRVTATDELRRLLDERGEYYKTSGNRTWWGRPIDSVTGEPINVFHNQAQPMGDDRLFVELQLATPQQAIDATLGRGTCRDVGRYAFVCSVCGWASDEPHHVLGGFWPKYCPECGRAVVE